MKNTDHKSPAISPLAGKPAPKEMLVDLARLGRFTKRNEISIDEFDGAGVGLGLPAASVASHAPYAQLAAC